MVEPNEVENSNPENESKLDDPFDNDTTLVLDNENIDASDHYPLSELKNLILSIDWEITDEVLEKLLQQIEDLNMTYEHDKTILTLLQILNSLGVYIKKNRAKAHPKTFKTLNSVFSNLDKVVLSKDMATADRKKILNTEMNRYQKLRIQIAQSKAEKKKSKTKRPEPGGKSPETFFPAATAGRGETAGTQQHRNYAGEDLANAVEEIKQFIHAEIEALKTEIKSLL